jgi:plasmid stability protein
LGNDTAWLLLVDYPDPAEAAAARAALHGAGVEDLVTVEAEGARLAAVFGQLDEAEANALLTQALGDE